MTRRTGSVVFTAALLALLAAGCSGGGKKESKAAAARAQSACPAAWKPGWQRLADRIKAPVYCPSWMPNPLTAEIGGPWGDVDSVDKRDRSYLVSFIWHEFQSGDVHVNLRGYPGRTAIPTCIEVDTVKGVTKRTKIPCFSDPRGHKRTNGIDATFYTVNQDTDQWHVLYAWRHDGSLYTLSEHVSPPLTYAKVVHNLDRMLRGLVLIRPNVS